MLADLHALLRRVVTVSDLSPDQRLVSPLAKRWLGNFGQPGKWLVEALLHKNAGATPKKHEPRYYLCDAWLTDAGISDSGMVYYAVHS